MPLIPQLSWSSLPRIGAVMIEEADCLLSKFASNLDKPQLIGFLG
jgi:hypothetical protein